MAGEQRKSGVDPVEEDSKKIEKSFDKKNKDFAGDMLKGINKAILKDKQAEFSKKPSVPDPIHEDRYKNQIESSEDDANEISTKPRQIDKNVEDVFVEPVDPFDVAPKVPVIEKKALDNKPLDKHKNNLQNDSNFKDEERKDPNEMSHAVEKMSDSKDFEENGGGDDDEIRLKEGASDEPIAEVVYSKGDENIVPGHVESVVSESLPDNSKENLWEILEQVGISKKKLIYVVLFILISIAFVFTAFSIFGDSSDTDPEVLDDQGVLSEFPESGSSEAYGIVSSYIFGLEFTTPKTPINAVPMGEVGSVSGITASFVFGGITEAFDSRIIYHMDVLRRMDSIYYTDVYELVDMYVDRRAAIDRHIQEVDDLLEEASLAFYEVGESMKSFDKEFEKISIEKDIFEEQFFIAIEQLLGQSTYDYLSLFIESSKSAVEIKAYYNSYKSIHDLYVLYIDSLTPRYRDITSNKEAIIKGIRVFDVPRSDIDAIIPLE